MLVLGQFIHKIGQIDSESQQISYFLTNISVGARNIMFLSNVVARMCGIVAAKQLVYAVLLACEIPM